MSGLGPYLWSSIFFLLLLRAGAQVERPNAQPYTLGGTYEKLKRDHPQVEPLGQEALPGILALEDITYRMAMGDTLRADLYFPQWEGQRFPAVILVHGGGWISGSKENLRPMARHLAQRGILAMTVNYRLADRAKFPAALEDLWAAVDHLMASDRVLPGKIAILGASAGAQLASLAGLTDPDIKAIINVDGIVSFIHPEAREGQYAAYWLGGTQAERPDLWKNASPLEKVHPASPPILFLNSSQPRFHAGRDDMIKKYRQWGIYSKVHTFPDSPHSFWLVRPWFGRTLELSVEFLNKVFAP